MTNKNNLLISLAFLLLVIESKCYFELQIDRKVLPTIIDTSKVIDIMSANFQCPVQFSHPDKINRTSTPQICQRKDLLYTVKILIGEGLDYNFEVLQLGLDLSIPWTWIVSDKCVRCVDGTDFPAYKDMKKFDECKISCGADIQRTNLTKSEYRITPQMRKVEQTFAEIVSFDTKLWGQYIYDSFSFLAYDPDERQTFTQFLEQNFDPKDFSKFDEIVQLKNFQFLAIDQMIGYSGFPAHGAIGLGLTLTESDNVEIEENTFFMEKLALSIEEDRKTDQVFSIFIHDKTGPNYNDYLVTFGGFNQRYSYRSSEEIQYVNLVKDTGYYWTLPIQYLRVRPTNNNNPDEKAPLRQDGLYESSQIQFGLPYGIISLSTSFIALPQIQFLRLKELIVSQLPGVQCVIVDQYYMALHCSNLLNQLQLKELKFQIFFEGSDDPVQLDSDSLIRKCNLSLTKQERYDCLFNIQMSRDDQTILGEPLLQKHYTIFDADNMRIGFLPAAFNSDWIDEISYSESFWWLSQFLLIVLGTGLILICFTQNIRSCLKGARNFLHFGLRQSATNEGQRLHVSNKEEDQANYQDIRETMKQIALSKSRQQIFDDKDQREKQLEFNIPNPPQQEVFNNFGDFEQNQPPIVELNQTEEAAPDININIPNIEDLQ